MVLLVAEEKRNLLQSVVRAFRGKTVWVKQFFMLLVVGEEIMKLLHLETFTCPYRSLLLYCG